MLDPAIALYHPYPQYFHFHFSPWDIFLSIWYFAEFTGIFSDPARFIESIVIPAATIVYASTVADKSTFDAIATGLGGFALGLPIDDNEAANFLFRLRFVFEGIEKRLLATAAPTTTTAAPAPARRR